MRSIVTVLLLAAVTVAVACALAGLRAYQLSAADFVTTPRAFVAPSAIAGHEALVLTTRSGRKVAASFVPPRTGVAVVAGHGMPGTRADLWSDVEALAAAGCGVLALDWPGLGESEGPIRFGSPEREAFTAAVDFLSGRPEVKRIGAYGFSNGAALLTAFVADEPRVTSLLAVAAWSDAIEVTRYEYREWGVLRQWPAEWAAASRIEGGNLSPLAAAPRLRGRKTLFVAGGADDVVPLEMPRALSAAAEGELKVIDGAGHFDVRARFMGLSGFFAP